MSDRVSRRKREEGQLVAEREVRRYAHDHALWHRHVHGVNLDPMQVLKCVDMDRHPNSIDFSARRTGKTAIKELYLLRYLSLNADQELGIVAPREAQALVNLGYHLDAIRRSQILSAYLAYKSARTQMADTYYQFANRSLARAYGIMAQVDGGDLTAASLEEVDDMPRVRLFGRFLLMMGSTRRLGADDSARNDPQIRVTGVFKGADTLTELIAGGHYHTLPTVDVHLGIQLGILNASFMAQMRDELGADEYIRQLLCRNISARNAIWEIYVRRSMQLGLQSGITWVQPMPGEQYKPRGEISIGYDASGHGEQPESSKHAAVVVERIGNHIAVIYCRVWAPGVDDMVVKRDLLSLWRYFMPQHAIGDAYGVGMLTALNDDLFAHGLTSIDRRAIGEGDSTASTWPDWPFSPLRFEGGTKHQMIMALRAIFHHEHAVMPYYDDCRIPTELVDLDLLRRQLSNIAPKATKASYPSYKMANPKIGDDLFDAACAAVWDLATRGIQIPTIVLSTSHARGRLLVAQQPIEVDE